MFKAIGAALAIYVCYAVFQGSVYAKSGPGGRAVSREEAPGYFWVVVGIYAALSGALIFVF
jgi:hypothetical protein